LQHTGSTEIKSASRIWIIHVAIQYLDIMRERSRSDKINAVVIVLTILSLIGTWLAVPAIQPIIQKLFDKPINKSTPSPSPASVNTQGPPTQSPISKRDPAPKQTILSINTAAPDPITAPQLRVQKSGRVMLLVAETVNGSSIWDTTIAQSLSKKMVERGLSVMLDSEIGRADLLQLRRALQKLQLGDKSASGMIPFAVVVMGTVSITANETFEGLYGAKATGSLKAIAINSGSTVAFEDISGARGFGNTQDEALKNTFKQAGERISDSFIRQISANAH